LRKYPERRDRLACIDIVELSHRLEVYRTKLLTDTTPPLLQATSEVILHRFLSRALCHQYRDKRIGRWIVACFVRLCIISGAVSQMQQILKYLQCRFLESAFMPSVACGSSFLRLTQLMLMVCLHLPVWMHASDGINETLIAVWCKNQVLRRFWRNAPITCESSNTSPSASPPGAFLAPLTSMTFMFVAANCGQCSTAHYLLVYATTSSMIAQLPLPSICRKL